MRRPRYEGRTYAQGEWMKTSQKIEKTKLPTYAPWKGRRK